MRRATSARASAVHAHRRRAGADRADERALRPGRKASALTVPVVHVHEPEVAHVGLTSARRASVGSRPTRSRSRSTTSTAPCSTARPKVLSRGAGRSAARSSARRSSRRTRATHLRGVRRHGREARVGALANVVHPYPTQAEVVKKAGGCVEPAPASRLP
jgi:pyruvate/2-oxoglutarate dehydrogenase complex dihydrolipoamide dehydrogenase (E3) component